MNMRIIYTSLAIFWFFLFVGMASREWWMPPWLLIRAETPQSPIITALLLMFAIWNLSKVRAARRPATPRSRIDPKLRDKIKSISGEDLPVTDPQFSFEDKQTKPS